MKKVPFLLVAAFSLFAFTGIVNNLLGALVPDISTAFSINLTMTSLLSFSLFLAYGFFSVPAGILLEKFHSKPLIIFALCLILGSSLCLIFLPLFGIAVLICFSHCLGGNAIFVGCCNISSAAIIVLVMLVIRDFLLS